MSLFESDCQFSFTELLFPSLIYWLLIFHFWPPCASATPAQPCSIPRFHLRSPPSSTRTTETIHGITSLCIGINHARYSSNPHLICIYWFTIYGICIFYLFFQILRGRGQRRPIRFNRTNGGHFEARGAPPSGCHGDPLPVTTERRLPWYVACTFDCSGFWIVKLLFDKILIAIRFDDFIFRILFWILFWILWILFFCKKLWN